MIYQQHLHGLQVGYDYTGDRWAFFTFIVLLMDLAISTVYRSAAYSIKSQETAMIASSVFIGAFG